MNSVKLSAEKKTLRFSVIGSLTFSVLGVGFFLFSGSQAILLDGAFNFISFLTAMFSLKIVDLLERPETEKFPVGFVAFEPFFLVIKGFTILTLTLVIVISNIQTLLSGGRTIKLDVAIVYILLAVAGSILITIFITRSRRDIHSPMIEIEQQNWFINSLISCGIALALIIVYFLREGQFSKFIPYVDQVIVIIIGVLTIPIPIKSIWDGLRDMLLIAPPEDILSEIKNIVSEKLKNYDLVRTQIFTLRTGRKLWITVYFKPSEDQVAVSDVDGVKKELQNSLAEKWANISVEVIPTSF